MRTRPIAPAQIEWGDDGVPRAPQFGDLYHARIGALEQARQVFIAGNRLPERWVGRDDFVIAETGFGLGNNFLATWDAWRRSAAGGGRRLHYVGIDLHPPTRADLQRAHMNSELAPLAMQLLAAWPPLVPGLHAIDLDGGSLQLTLAFGDAEALLPQLVFRADAFYLDGFAPPRNPAMWSRRLLKALARRAAPGATAATWSVARELRDGLVEAGFEVERVAGPGEKREVLRAVHAPRHSVARVGAEPPPRRQAVVVGAGLAGASAAAALARLGFDVRVLEGAAAPAGAASGNPAGLFHGTVHADDGPYARLFRAAALQVHREIAALQMERPLPCGLDGVIRIEPDTALGDLQARLSRLGLPADYVVALDAAAAGEQAGVTLSSGAWRYRQAGWVAPGALVERLLEDPRIALRTASEVAAIVRRDGDWACLDAAGSVLAQAPALVLAHAQGVEPLLRRAGIAAWPMRSNRGQLSVVSASHGLRLPVAGAGYAIPIDASTLVCGATQDDSEDREVRERDHRENIDRLRQLTGIRATADPRAWTGRVGQRLLCDDRLPVAGRVADATVPVGPSTQVRHLPRVPGLHVLAALGGRGITLAPLLGRLVAAQIAGTPLPLEQDLADAVDPGRWRVRAARRGGG